jgi:hypothetical protein
MNVKTLFLATALAMVASAVYAVNDGGVGTGGTNFSCDVNTGGCKCEGVEAGADCQAMLKNCKDKKMGACHDEPGDRWCVCNMYRSATPTPKPGKVQTAPLQRN